jgi:phospholipase A-2-activating protein
VVRQSRPHYPMCPLCPRARLWPSFRPGVYPSHALSPLPWGQAFHLVGELRGHSEDVRAVALAGPHGVATTSRDKTLRTWPVDGAAQLRGEGTVFVGHTDFVGPVVWAPPGLLPVAPEGALVTGSRDTTVLLWHPTAAVTLQRLAGHCLQVRMGQ